MAASLKMFEVFHQPPKSEDEQSVYWRVVWVSADHSWLIQIVFDNPPAWPHRVPRDELQSKLDRSEWIRSDYKLPGRYYLSDADKNAPDYDPTDRKFISVKEQERRDERRKTIASLITRDALREIFEEGKGGQLVAAAAATHDHSRDYVYEALKLHWLFGGIANALIPFTWRCGAPGQPKPATDKKRGRPRLDVVTGHAPERTGINIDEAAQDLIKSTYLSYFTPGMKPAEFTRIVQKRGYTQGELNADGTMISALIPEHRRPTKGQVIYWLKRLVERSFLIRRGATQREYDLTKRDLHKRGRDGVWYPNQLFYIDSTVLDLYLVSAFNSKWLIGRPIVYFVIDVMSGMIVGFHIALTGPDGAGAKAACYSAFSDKMPTLERLGFTNVTADDWPAQYMPDKVGSDRGEMFTAAVHAAFSAGGSTALDVLPALRPDLKPHIECFFRVANDKLVKWIPGAVRKRASERGERDYRLDACLNIFQLWRLIGRFVVLHNTTCDARSYAPAEALQDGVTNLVPRALYTWGLENANGAPAILPREELITRFLPAVNATVGRDGIYVGSARYGGVTPTNEHWSMIARHHGSHRITVRHDPCLGSEVHWLNPRSGQYERLRRLDSNIPDYATQTDVVDRNVYLELLRRDQSDDREARISEFMKEVEETVKAASAEAREARGGMSKAEFTGDVGEKRREELRRLHGDVPGKPEQDMDPGGADADILERLLEQQAPRKMAA